MEIKLFGKSLFTFKSGKSDAWLVPSMDKVQKSNILPDFKKIGSGNSWGSGDFIEFQSVATISSGAIEKLEKKDEPKKKEKEKLTPKRVYDLKMLHDKSFQINMDPKYVDGQLEDFKSKLGLMNDPGYNHRGFDEVGSIVIRLENRKKYPSVKAVFDKFPYTTNTRISNVLKKHDYLQLGEVDQFVADMPKDAIEAMKEYNLATQKVCQKKAVFYIIADKKDFKKTESRRDPILLAQSPFGHFWQIIGAWDKEMMFLEEL